MKIARLIFIVCLLIMPLKTHSQMIKKIQTPLNRTVVFLQNYFSSDTCDYNIAFLAKYLSVKYHRDDLHFDFDHIPARLEDHLIPYNFYAPLIGLKIKQDEDSLYQTYEGTVGLEHLMLWAVHAEKISLDSIAKKTILDNIQQTANIRNICHVAISISWARNHMKAKDHQFIASVEKEITNVMVQKLNSKKNIDDDFMEGVVGLICLNKKKRIKNDQLDLLLSTQNQDGGWAWVYQDISFSHPHTTILAYWILLELIK
jgi:hypothetical protein